MPRDLAQYAFLAEDCDVGVTVQCAVDCFPQLVVVQPHLLSDAMVPWKVTGGFVRASSPYDNIAIDLQPCE